MLKRTNLFLVFYNFCNKTDQITYGPIYILQNILQYIYRPIITYIEFVSNACGSDMSRKNWVKPFFFLIISQNVDLYVQLKTLCREFSMKTLCHEFSMKTLCRKFKKTQNISQSGFSQSKDHTNIKRFTICNQHIHL